MQTESFAKVLSRETLTAIFPQDRSNEFFDALFGDASEGAYDIELAYRSASNSELVMELHLHERPGHCLACNLTQGLPQVFSRHPIINIKGVVEKIDELLGDTVNCKDWKLGYTEQRSKSTHVIPLTINIENT